MNRPDTPSPERRPERDPLADFVHAHRDGFDAEAPPAVVWDRIEADLGGDPTAHLRTRPSGAAIRPLPQRDVPAAPPPPPEAPARIVTLYPYWRKAAVACMLLTIGVLSGLLLADRLGGGERGAVAALDADPLRELESTYQRLLEERIAEVRQLGPDSALNADLTAFSAPDSQRSAELSSLGGANEHLVLEAMAQEYQAKLDALERVLGRLRVAETRGRGTRARDRGAPSAAASPDSPVVHRL